MGALIADVRKIVVEHPSNLNSLLHHISEWKEASQFGVREDPNRASLVHLYLRYKTHYDPAREKTKRNVTYECMGCGTV